MEFFPSVTLFIYRICLSVCGSCFLLLPTITCSVMIAESRSMEALSIREERENWSYAASFLFLLSSHVCYVCVARSFFCFLCFVFSYYLLISIVFWMWFLFSRCPFLFLLLLCTVLPILPASMNSLLSRLEPECWFKYFQCLTRIDWFFARPVAADSIRTEVRKGYEMNKFGKVFGWTSLQGHARYVDKLFAEAGVDGMIYGFKLNHYVSSEATKEAATDILNWAGNHSQTHHVATLADAPWWWKYETRRHPHTRALTPHLHCLSAVMLSWKLRVVVQRKNLLQGARDRLIENYLQVP